MLPREGLVSDKCKFEFSKDVPLKNKHHHLPPAPRRFISSRLGFKCYVHNWWAEKTIKGKCQKTYVQASATPFFFFFNRCVKLPNPFRLYFLLLNRNNEMKEILWVPFKIEFYSWVAFY